MLASLLVAALTPLTYRFDPGSVADYAITTGFSGFLPIFGGREGTAEIRLSVNLAGVAPSVEGHPQFDMDLTDAQVSLDGTTLPFTLDNVKGFFPKSTFTVSPFGRQLATTAPAIELPIRLPGLDVQRFPELSFLAVEFPEAGIEAGSSWSFTRTLAGSEAQFSATASEISDSTATVQLTFKQSYSTWESAALEVVKDPNEAAAKVDTVVEGTGTVVFDRARSLLSTAQFRGSSVSTVTDTATQATSTRKMSTSLDVTLQPKPPKQ